MILARSSLDKITNFATVLGGSDHLLATGVHVVRLHVIFQYLYWYCKLLS